MQRGTHNKPGCRLPNLYRDKRTAVLEEVAAEMIAAVERAHDKVALARGRMWIKSWSSRCTAGFCFLFFLEIWEETIFQHRSITPQVLLYTWLFKKYLQYILIQCTANTLLRRRNTSVGWKVVSILENNESSNPCSLVMLSNSPGFSLFSSEPPLTNVLPGAIHWLRQNFKICKNLLVFWSLLKVLLLY